MNLKAAALAGGSVAVFFYVLWAFGGFVGAVYWAIQESLLNVVLSIFIPLYGGLSVIYDLIFG
ncbi:MAG: hypothetical protein WD341_07905 [Tistlia sp.]|uniref:hypothetical protein n=1 Tax=Tistlia sp. TaxID=3057121 RepID=UPI0034A38BD1